jgi:hypothetical protein
MVLLLCFAAAPVAVLGLLQYQKYMVRKAVKHRMMAGMDPSDLTLLVFSEADKQAHLSWEHDAEFAYRGQLYDVVHTVVRGDTTWYWVWPDAAESALNRRLHALVYIALGQEPGHRERHEQLAYFFKSLMVADCPRYTFAHRPQALSDPTPPLLLSGQLSAAPPLPPPR